MYQAHNTGLWFNLFYLSPALHHEKGINHVSLSVFLPRLPQAYKQELYGERYVWMLIGWYQSRWWNAHPAVLSKQNCEAKHVMKAFGNYVTTEFLKFGPSSPRMIGGEVWCNVDQKTRQISRLWGLGL